MNFRMIFLSWFEYILSFGFKEGIWKPSRNIHNTFPQRLQMLISNLTPGNGAFIAGFNFAMHISH
jgi:hypothetical protein